MDLIHTCWGNLVVVVNTRDEAYYCSNCSLISMSILQYQSQPVSWFQHKIQGDNQVLTDHISKEMNVLNLIRCKRIPKRPGADWRDLPNEKV